MIAFLVTGISRARWLHRLGTSFESITWNALNQMTGLTKNSVTEASHTYDPLGRRLMRVTAAGTTKWVYDRVDIVQTLGTGGTLFVHGPGVDDPLSQVRGGSTEYLHADALGSISRVTDVGGQVSQAIFYDVWGDIQTLDPPPTHSFTGREWDSTARMYFNRARFYDASRGRFVGEDPLGYGEGPNLYVYAFNSPSRFTDPTGKGAVAAVLPAAGGMAALDGPFPVGDVVAIGLIGVAATWDLIKVIEIVKTAEKCETQRCRLVDGNEEVGVPGTKGCRYACPDGTSFTLVVPESYWCTAEITRPSPVKKPPVKH